MFTKEYSGRKKAENAWNEVLDRVNLKGANSKFPGPRSRGGMEKKAGRYRPGDRAESKIPVSVTSPIRVSTRRTLAG